MRPVYTKIACTILATLRAAKAYRPHPQSIFPAIALTAIMESRSQKISFSYVPPFQHAKTNDQFANLIYRTAGVPVQNCYLDNNTSGQGNWKARVIVQVRKEFAAKLTANHPLAELKKVGLELVSDVNFSNIRTITIYKPKWSIKEAINNTSIVPVDLETGPVEIIRSSAPSNSNRVFITFASAEDANTAIANGCFISGYEVQADQITMAKRIFVPQCKRCYKWNSHSTQECPLREDLPMCSRCTGYHKFTTCTVPRENYLCRNCMGNHEAVDFKCPLAKEASAKIKSAFNKKDQAHRNLKNYQGKHQQQNPQQHHQRQNAWQQERTPKTLSNKDFQARRQALQQGRLHKPPTTPKQERSSRPQSRSHSNNRQQSRSRSRGNVKFQQPPTITKTNKQTPRSNQQPATSIDQILQEQEQNRKKYENLRRQEAEEQRRRQEEEVTALPQQTQEEEEMEIQEAPLEDHADIQASAQHTKLEECMLQLSQKMDFLMEQSKTTNDQIFTCEAYKAAMVLQLAVMYSGGNRESFVSTLNDISDENSLPAIHIPTSYMETDGKLTLPAPYTLKLIHSDNKHNETNIAILQENAHNWQATAEDEEEEADNIVKGFINPTIHRVETTQDQVNPSITPPEVEAGPTIQDLETFVNISCENLFPTQTEQRAAAAMPTQLASTSTPNRTRSTEEKKRKDLEADTSSDTDRPTLQEKARRKKRRNSNVTPKSQRPLSIQKKPVDMNYPPLFISESQELNQNPSQPQTSPTLYVDMARNMNRNVDKFIKAYRDQKSVEAAKKFKCPICSNVVNFGMDRLVSHGALHGFNKHDLTGKCTRCLQRRGIWEIADHQASCKSEAYKSQLTTAHLSQ